LVDLARRLSFYLHSPVF